MSGPFLFDTSAEIWLAGEPERLPGLGDLTLIRSTALDLKME